MLVIAQSIGQANYGCCNSSHAYEISFIDSCLVNDYKTFITVYDQVKKYINNHQADNELDLST